MRELLNEIRLLFIKNPSQRMKIRAKKWFEDYGDKTHRINYNLGQKSIVFDVGGYKGEWAGQIYEKYKSIIYIFEPHPEFYKQIEQKFKSNKNIHPYNFGLADKDQTHTIADLDNSSSIYRESKSKIEIKLVDIAQFIQENNIEKIDLMKINIEGGEYDLLDKIISTKLHLKIKNIQVQFHEFMPEAHKRMKQIQKELKKSHQLTYQYKFIWENWELK